MKKALIGIAAGAVALGASVVPASAGTQYLDENIWDGIQAGDCSWAPQGYDGDWDGEDLFEQLVLIGGWSTALDTSGNGKPSYTVFAPVDAIIYEVLDSMNLETSDLNSQISVVKAILADHIANGSFAAWELENANLTRITMRSGYVATVWGEFDPVPGTRAVPGNVTVGGAYIGSKQQYSNGWLYCIVGFIDSTPQVPTEGLNSQDTPQDGTPGGTNSLPNTL